MPANIFACLLHTEHKCHGRRPYLLVPTSNARINLVSDASVCAEKQPLAIRNGEGVSALIVGGARIRADMRLRSKQQRRVMNAEFSNGICLA